MSRFLIALAGALIAASLRAADGPQDGGVSAISTRAFGAAAWRETGVSPSALPLIGNSYFDVYMTTDMHLRVWNGLAWIDATATGSPGPPGAPGTPGAAASVSVGSVTTGAPGSSASVSNSGTSSAAVLDFLIPRGNAGTAGTNGTNGANGTNGTDGNAVRSGSGVPSNGLGVNGDFYVDASTTTIYGPKAAGAWGTGTPLLGAPGANGSNGTNGVNGATWSSGSGVPSGGADGDFYLRTGTGDVYKRAAGTWGVAANLIGPAGTNGSNGTNGMNGLDGAPGAAGPAGPAPSGAANQVLATPNGSAGVSALRAIVAADLPAPFPASSTATASNFLTAYAASTGVFTKARPACADLSNAAASCSTDATNASNLTGGTVPIARLPVFAASGASHAAGIVPDPGASAGTTKFLREDATWQAVAGGVGGPTASTDTAIPRWSGTTGNALLDSLATLDGSGTAYFPGGVWLGTPGGAFPRLTLCQGNELCTNARRVYQYESIWSDNADGSGETMYARKYRLGINSGGDHDFAINGSGSRGKLVVGDAGGWGAVQTLGTASARAACDSSTEGTIWYSSVAHQHCFCEGATPAWTTRTGLPCP